MEWTYRGELFTEELAEGYAGFVYLIVNRISGKRYIGKKTFVSKRSRKPLKGRKNKRRYTVPSDWAEYYGSSDALLADVESLGKDKFSREVLILCKSKGWMSYHESRLQFEHNVLEGDGWYNAWIMCRIRRAHLS